jgi:hypothetical protein
MKKPSKHLVADTFHFFTHLDSKYLRTLITMFVRPVKITRNISQGITIRYFNLTSFYLIGLVICFLIPASIIGFGYLNNPFSAQLENGFFIEWKNTLAEKYHASSWYR